MPSISTIILTSRPRSLRACLQSLAAAQTGENVECLLVLNNQAAECSAAAAEFSGKITGLKILADAPRSLGGARNAALRAASGDWLCFIDDDVVLPQDYYSVLSAAALAHPEACAIGGPNLTPPQSPLFERCVGHILGSRLCAGSCAKRCGGLPRDTWTDDSGLILCNLALRRKTLAAEGLRFDEDLVRNEENLLLSQLLSRGARALHCPRLFVYHERRATLAAFCRQCFLSGRGRAQMTLRRPASLKAFHLAPLAAASGALGLAVFSPGALLLAAAAYAALAAFTSLCLVLRHSENLGALGWLLILYPSAHLSYAAGLLAGLTRPAAALSASWPKQEATLRAD